jgi:cobalamin synthase
MLILLVYIVLLLSPTFAVVLWVALLTRRERAKSAVPFTELQRRPAGESTRLKMERYSEDLDTWLMAIVFVPIALVLILNRR